MCLKRKEDESASLFDQFCTQSNGTRCTFEEESHYAISVIEFTSKCRTRLLAIEPTGLKRGKNENGIKEHPLNRNFGKGVLDRKEGVENFPTLISMLLPATT